MATKTISVDEEAEAFDAAIEERRADSPDRSDRLAGELDDAIGGE